MSSFNSIAFREISTEDISVLFSSDISVHVLRFDKTHSSISGNKWFKLHPYLQIARKQEKKGIITFGGAWSNHILATAVACKLEGMQSIGLIRGEESSTPSFTLEKARAAGMQLYYLSREDYRSKLLPAHINTEELLIVNEGGYGKPGAAGAATMLNYCGETYTHYCCATGTGTMLAGLINASKTDAQLIGISVMKNNFSLNEQVAALLDKTTNNWGILHDYHFGGYAKHPPELIGFMNKFYTETGIPSDIVYTGKLFYAVNDLIMKGFFPAGSRIMVVHSGGLQGNNSVPKGTLMF